MLVSPGTCESCHSSSQSQNLVRQNTKEEAIFKIGDHNVNKFQFVKKKSIFSYMYFIKIMYEN